MTRVRCSSCSKYGEIELPKEPPDSVAWECVHCGAANAHEVTRRLGDSDGGRGTTRNK